MIDNDVLMTFQELSDKSNDPEVRSCCPDIRWHFIGNCQSNKVPRLAKCPNLFAVETLTSAKLADKLNSQCAAAAAGGRRLKVMIQVNTSKEENKNGLSPSEAPSLARHVQDSCANLELAGLMTIGALGHSLESAERLKGCKEGENPDFLALIRTRY